MSEQVSAFFAGHAAPLQRNSAILNVQEVLGAALIFQYDNRHELGWGPGCQQKSVTSRRPVKLTFYIVRLCLGHNSAGTERSSCVPPLFEWVQTLLYGSTGSAGVIEGAGAAAINGETIAETYILDPAAHCYIFHCTTPNCLWQNMPPLWHL